MILHINSIRFLNAKVGPSKFYNKDKNISNIFSIKEISFFIFAYELKESKDNMM